MKYITAVHTDVGIKKSTNQDSVFVEIAETDYGQVTLAVVCDGMGGLKNGEVASAMLIRAFSSWFHQEFPKILYSGFDSNQLMSSWTKLILEQNQRIMNYGVDNYVSLGTTCIALLLVEDAYYIINVGDSRVYLFNDKVNQLTIDQTFVQKEVDMGRMTLEQAMVHPKRNVLLQCVGASLNIEPVFHVGEYEKGNIFMLCSDGFRHLISEEEFMNIFNPQYARTAEQLKDGAVYLTELNKSRNETDNISVALIRTC